MRRSTGRTGPHYISHICVVDLFASSKCDLFHIVYQLLCANTAGSVHIHWPWQLHACRFTSSTFYAVLLCKYSSQPVTLRFLISCHLKHHRATSNHYKWSMLCCLFVLTYLTAPLSAGKLIGPHCPPSDALFLLIQQIPAQFPMVALSPPAAPTFSLQEFSDFALLPLGLPIRRVSAFLLSTLQFDHLFIIYCSLHSNHNIHESSLHSQQMICHFLPQGPVNAKKSMLLNWGEGTVTQFILQHYFSPF